MHTPDVSAFALMVQGAEGPAGTGEVQTDFFQLLGEGGAIAQVVLVILLLFSLISWAVILYKFWQFSRVNRQTRTFLDVFRKSSKFSEVHAVCRTLTESPLTGLFQAGYGELNTQLRGPNATEAKPTPAAGRPTLKSLDAVDRALLRATTVEMTRLEHWVPFLATTASITPFIGLFGTVWGIMNSFRAIALSKSTNLAVVAPGIAEALFATALGLLAAIPAVVFYNKFANDIGKLGGRLENFNSEFSAIISRQLDERA